MRRWQRPKSQSSPRSPRYPRSRIPCPKPPDPTPALPELDASDGPFHDALAETLGKGATDRFFKPELLVRHIVVTIDNLSRRHLAVELRPTKPLDGAFIATGNDQQGTIDTANYQRYLPYVQVVQQLDMKRMASLYVHFYPLFQQAYQALGYPNGYFNDRLVVTIDNLLAAPDITTDIAVVRPNVMYQFADPKLEDLSAGQKLMLRMGPANAAIVKAKLRELRAQVAVAAARPAAPAGAIQLLLRRPLRRPVQQIRRRILIGQDTRLGVPVRARGEHRQQHLRRDAVGFESRREQPAVARGLIDRWQRRVRGQDHPVAAP
jgi:hypothetical protein